MSFNQTTSRFDYVKYDDAAAKFQASFKEAAQKLESLFYGIGSERWREAGLMKLEEAYMCAGKGIRDDQITRNGCAPLQEERNNE